MSNTKDEVIEHKTKNLREIEEIIAKAIKKVGASKENDLCKYLPMSTGGYMHHFTLRKMKVKQPDQLGSLIEKFIINTSRPSSVTPKSRAPRGSRKRRVQMPFTRNQIEKMLQIARLTGDKEIIAILSPKRSLAITKRELIASIRREKVDQDLWNAYVECVAVMQSHSQTSE
ncbi:MAG: hypothetical protein L0207_06520 [Chlamydiae bacterium]|nr:hypothetical protein [Chlamydiota bacterium]